jgi:hypothetical protein
MRTTTEPFGPELARRLLDGSSPLQPDPVDSPEVVFRSGTGARLIYPARGDEHFVQVSFDRFDALRVCRGEYPPYVIPQEHGSCVFTVESSRWLLERYNYEFEHYGKNQQYGFGRDVGEMLDEFDHFLFLFHDEFVEVIAGGVCFETSPAPFAPGARLRRPGLDELADEFTAERFEEHGIWVQVRRDPRPRPELLAASRLCEQSLYQVALELDGATRVTHRLAVRTRDGQAKSRWRSSFGRVEATFDGVPDEIQVLRPLIAAYVSEVAAQRKTMRKRE